MNVSSGNLDSLVNTQFMLTNYSGIVFQSYSLSAPSAGSPTLSSESVEATGVPGFSGLQNPSFTATITSIDDPTNTLQVTNDFGDAGSDSLTEYVIGFSPDALLISLVDPGTLAQALQQGADPSGFDSSLYVLSDIPPDAGTLITLTSDAVFTDPLPCFARGTRLETSLGRKAVEHLAVGDVVRSHHAGWVPIRWIGHARVDCRRHSRPDDVTPVRVRAGAFAANVPRRDVLLSPGHAVFAAGVLIPAHHLINGATIVREPDVGVVQYFHVELAAHDVLFADGLPAESFLDDGAAAYLEGRSTRLLRPDHLTRSWNDACAPKCESGPELDAVRRELRARALELGHRLAPGRFDLWAGPTRLAASDLDGRVWRFSVPAGMGELRLRSASTVAAGVLEDCDDARRLGVRLGGVRLDGEAIPLGSEMLASGFHAVEHVSSDTWRWSDGAGLLRLPPSRRARTLELLVTDVLPVWTMPGQVSGQDATQAA